MTMCVSIGQLPKGKRLERVKASPNYINGQFRNKADMEEAAAAKAAGADKKHHGGMLKFLFGKKPPNLRPSEPLPTMKTDLKDLDPAANVYVWMGHSAFFLQVDGKRFLVDPTLVSASPVSFINKPFKGAQVYKPEDMPAVDCLLISHDHWDHLDYHTVKKIKDRVGLVICGLGVGQDFAYWGYKDSQIRSCDWGDTVELGGGCAVHVLPTRHFTGRWLTRNQTEPVSFMITTPKHTIYYSGDGGWDDRFAKIAKEFPEIDLAIMENGQYNLAWHSVHEMPDELVKAVETLHPAHLVTVHNSKYCESVHPWYEPMEKIAEADEKLGLHLETPEIGQAYYFDENQHFSRWWVPLMEKEESSLAKK
jgi:L-ascorbate metabolism protein UlaG (beta-lactamase superfamily)